MDYQKSSSIAGSWAKGSELTQVERAEIITETKPHPSNYLNKDGSVKMQDVCKVKFDGQEPLNVNLNRPTINALIDAFGKNSTQWMNKKLSVETEKVKVAGKTVTALYLIPEGFKKVDDADGYTVIVRENEGVQTAPDEEIPIIDVEDDGVKIGEIPF